MPARSGTIVIHVPLEPTILINGTDYSDYVISYRFYEELNQMREFEITLADIGSTEKSDVAEGNVVKFMLGRKLIFKGIISKAEYQTHDFAKISGYGSLETLLSERVVEVTSSALSSSTFARPFYSQVATSTIVSEQLANESDITVGTNENLGTISVRSEMDNKLAFLASIAENRNGEWWASHGSYPYDDEVFNIASRRGSTTSVKTYEISGITQNANVTSREKDYESLWNVITVLGRGDGQNQLYSKISHSTLKRTKLAADMSATDTTCTVEDASVFSVNDVVWIGMEQCTITAIDTANNTLTVTRASSDGTDSNGQEYLQAYAHSAGVAVYDASYYEYSPEETAGVSVYDYGIKAKVVANPKINDQDALDLLATKLLDEHYQLVERITLELSEFVENLTSPNVGDTITVNDSEAGLSGEYRVYSKEITDEEGDRKIVLEVANGRRKIMEELQEVSTQLNANTQFTQGAINVFTKTATENTQETLYEYQTDEYTNALYHFENSLYDSSGRSYGSQGTNYWSTYGTYTGSEWYDENGYIGIGTNELNGSNYLFMNFTGGAWPDFFQDMGTSGTIEFYVYPTDLSGDLVFVRTYNSDGNEDFVVGYESDTGTVRAWVSIASGSPMLESTTTLSANTWYHIAVTWDGSTHKLYINKTEEDSASSSIGFNTNPNEIRFGLGVGKAKYDEVRFSSIARTSFDSPVQPAGGKPIKVMFEIPDDAVKINSVKLSYKNVAPRTWNTTANDYDVNEKTYSTTDVQIWTTNDASSEPITWTDRTSDIESDLGRSLKAAYGESEASLDLTEYFSGTGWKGILFATDGNSRHELQVTVKCYVER